jgi:hypothetical protein
MAWLHPWTTIRVFDVLGPVHSPARADQTHLLRLAPGKRTLPPFLQDAATCSSSRAILGRFRAATGDSRGNAETSVCARAFGESCHLYKRPLRYCVAFLLLPFFSTQCRERPALVVRCGVHRGGILPWQASSPFPRPGFSLFYQPCNKWEKPFFYKIIKIYEQWPSFLRSPSHPPPEPKPKPRPIDLASSQLLLEISKEIGLAKSNRIT